MSVAALSMAPLATPSAAAPTGAPRAAENFTLSLVEGELLIRDAEEPYELENPTSITAMNETTTGAISGGTFSTPTVVLEQDITSPVEATVVIEADFAPVTPNSASGTVSDTGAMTVTTSLTVDLDIEVQPPGGGTPFLTARCTSSPVSLTLESTSPYDDATDKVTLADEDFTIPAAVAAPACTEIIRGEVNAQLAGTGHSLEMTLTGALTLPPPPGCPTGTSLAASPVDGAYLGSSVELTATITPVASDPLCIEAAEEAISGFVDFYDGEALVGTQEVGPGGVAVLTTSALPAGTRTLHAVYRGGGSYSTSQSADLAYTVAAKPAITADLPEYIQISAPATEFDLTVTNNGFGTDVTNARIDVTLARVASGGSLNADQVLLEARDGDGNWQPVTLTAPATRTLLGRLDPATGQVLPSGETVTRRLRLTAGPGASLPSIGQVRITFEVIPVDPDAGTPAPAVAPAPAALASAVGIVNLVEGTRRASTVAFGSSFSGGPVSPNTLRQGETLSLPSVAVNPLVDGQRPSGFIEIYLDGQRAKVRQAASANAAPDAPDLDRARIIGATQNIMFDLPPSVSAGVHQITVRYLGDALFLPSQANTTVTVIEPAGVAYDCFAPFETNTRYRAMVEAQANVPSSAAVGSEPDLDHLTVRMLFSRERLAQNFSRNAVAPANGSEVVGPELTIGFSFGPGGTGTAAGVQRVNGTPLPAAPPGVIPAGYYDETLTFTAPTGSLDIAGTPGDTVPVTLDEIALSALDTASFPHPITCAPVGEAVLLGEVTVTGNSLAVSPGGPVREGDDVTLTSTVAPYTTGTVEFRDGVDTIGVVPVVDGVASMTTDDLADGTRTLTAVYYGGLLMPPLLSNSIDIEVIAIDCSAYAEAGNGAVVRLVYLELLGRCPDPAGFDYWVGRLEAGLSPEVFAQLIAATPEAVGRVVDDAYETMLGRGADGPGRAFWIGRLRASGRYDQLLADLGASGEFWTLAGATNEGFVARVYERLLGRSPDQAGQDYWVGRLAAGMSRRTLILALADLDEPLGRLVGSSYEEILGRVPTPGERGDGITFLLSTGDRTGLNAQLIGRPEFADRAGTFPNLT